MFRIRFCEAFIMNINKSQALLMYTFIYSHLNSVKSEEFLDEESYEQLKDLQDQIRDFLVGKDINYSRYSEESDGLEESCFGKCDHHGVSSDEDLVKDEAHEVENEPAEDEEEDTNCELPEVEDYLKQEDLNELPSILVTSPTGNSITLEFENIDEEDCIDVLLDEGSVVLESACRLKLTEKTVEIFDEEECHTFLLQKKLPKSWSKSIKKNTVYGFKQGNEE